MTNVSQLQPSLPSDTTLPRQPSEDLREHLLQLHNIKNAFETLTPASPNAVTLLPPDSLFPGLLALRTVAQTVSNTRTAVQRTRKEIIYVQNELSRERVLLQDAREFGTNLKAQIGQISDLFGSRSSTESGLNKHEEEEDRVRTYLFAALEAQEQRVGTIRQGTEHLKRAISLFSRERLAPILLEEELRRPDGGREPSVGSLNEANDYNDTGCEEKEGLIPLRLSRKRKIQEKTLRQKDFSYSWNHVQYKEDSSLPNASLDPSIAQERVLQEIEQLIKDLVGALRSGDTGTYITLKRVSSQARYLVSAKIAEIHPKDATRLRLVDFG